MIEFTIPGLPIAKGRPRFTTKGGFGRTYTPVKTVNAENVVAMYAQMALKRPLAGAIRLEVITIHPVPKSWPKADKAEALADRIRPTTKPDADNLGKLVLDALNGVGYADDKQVVELIVLKFYGEKPLTVVRLSQL